MHVLILVFWGETKITHWGKAILMWPVWLWICTCDFLRIHSRVAKLIAFLSPTHFVMWLLLLLYGIFSQCLQENSLCESMCVISSLPPLHVNSHFSQVSTRSSCFVWMCILRCLSEGASCCIWHKKACWLKFCSTDNSFECQIWWYFRTKKLNCRFW